MKPDGREDDGVSIDNVKAIRGTGKALLCRIAVDDDSDGPREVWVPQSQITEDSDVFSVGDEGTLVVTSWFAEREGLR